MLRCLRIAAHTPTGQRAHPVARQLDPSLIAVYGGKSGSFKRSVGKKRLLDIVAAVAPKWEMSYEILLLNFKKVNRGSRALNCSNNDCKSQCGTVRGEGVFKSQKLRDAAADRCVQ
eukprot:scaffold147146_cov26-Tisochrysis_lutea.AAC.1